MKGVVRTALLMFSWAPLQRRLLLIGVGLVIAGHLLHSKSLLLSMALPFGLALMLVPALIVGGTMFRSISAPRSVGLIPHARLKMLFGALLSLMASAGFVTANVALLKSWGIPPGLAQAPLTHVFIATLTVETILLLGLFLLSTSRYALWVLIAILGIAPTLPSPLVAISSDAAGPSLIDWAAILTAGVWLAFAVWYLSARRIARSLWTDLPQIGWSRPVERETLFADSRGSAITTLLGLPSNVRVAWRGFGAFVIFLAMIALMFVRPGHLMPNLGDMVLFMGFFFVLFHATLMGVAVAHRSRLLWLASGCTRGELFQLCERLAWRCLAAVSAPIFLLCAGAWILLPHQASSWPYLLTATLGPAACGLYLGLMNVTGWRFIDAAVAVFLLLTALVAIVNPLFSGVPPSPAVTSIPIVSLLAAVCLRSLGKRRWRKIDWLICKPPRLSSQALRPVSY